MTACAASAGASSGHIPASSQLWFALRELHFLHAVTIFVQSCGRLPARHDVIVRQRRDREFAAAVLAAKTIPLVHVQAREAQAALSGHRHAT